MITQMANKNEVRKEIADLINRIKEQSDRIGMQREIPQSELDLILHRIEELHRKTVVWSYLNELPVEVPGSKFNVSGADAIVPTVGYATQPDPPAPPAEDKKEVINIPPVVVPEVKQQVVQNFEPKGPIEPVVKVEHEPVKVEPNASAAVTEPAAPKVEAAKQLKDIRTFIGFNEKLMYIRQVFKGDNEAYNAALDQINGMKSWTEAEAFLGMLGGEYKWGKENEPVAIFTHTVKQRFI